jgi:pSer/pThr/pTyr-binding forkhead associated (FHA) protein
MLAELYVVRGRDAGKALELGDGALVSIGRSFTNDIRLRDPQVSRVHCRFEVVQDAVLLHDL